MEQKNTLIVIIIILFAVILFMAWDGAFQKDKTSEDGDNVATTTEESLDNTDTTGEPASAPKTTTQTPTEPAVPTQPVMTSDGRYLISYEKDGFNPQNLTLPNGTPVRFINNSNKAMLVYSKEAQQPYSSLNQSKSVGQGAIYNFTFMSTGLWEFYNRNNPGDTGSVVVY